MTGESWNIHWNEYTKDTYLYGSELVFHAKDDVEFKNELMPPGTVIKSWFSRVNYQLMLATMDCCYDTMQENRKEIDRIAQWVSEVRVELKKRLIRKQEMEQQNNAIYSYMHDVFGTEVIEIFDMQYESGEEHPKMP